MIYIKHKDTDEIVFVDCTTSYICTALESAAELKADLDNAYISNSTIILANLEQIHLSNALIKDCDFLATYLNKANFKGATLTNVNFTSSDLEGADFTDATLTNVNFKLAYTDGIILDNVIMDEYTRNSLESRGRKYE